MLYPIKKRSWLFLTSLLFSLSLVLVIGAPRSSACGGCPLKKDASAEKEGETPNCPYHSKDIHTTENQTYTCPMHPEVSSDKPGNCDKCGMKLVLAGIPAEDNPSAVRVTNPEAFKTVERYVCPMHSEVIKKKKGNCPECGMKLEKREFYEVYVCPMKECPHISEKGGKCCGEKMNKKLMSSEEFEKLTQLSVEYICPMHPEVTSNEPGNCPKCGMKLEMK
jgi:Cu(I)/Ag(I) efflux system membrane fusion protein